MVVRKNPILNEDDFRFLKAIGVRQTNQSLNQLSEYSSNPQLGMTRKEIIFTFQGWTKSIVVKVEKRAMQTQFLIEDLMGKETWFSLDYRPGTELPTLLREAKLDGEIIKALIDEKVEETIAMN